MARGNRLIDTRGIHVGKYKCHRPWRLFRDPEVSIMVQFQSSISYRRGREDRSKSISMPISWIGISQGVRAFASCINSTAATSRPACIRDSDWIHYFRTNSLTLARSVMFMLRSSSTFCFLGKIKVHRQRRIGNAAGKLADDSLEWYQYVGNQPMP